MSMKPGSRSAPEIASASAELYQVSATMPGAKSENTNVAPAEPSTFGPSGLNCAPTKTGWSLTSTEPHRSAANWATIRRCSPSVVPGLPPSGVARSEEHTSELQSLMRISYAVFCLKKKNTQQTQLQDD